MEQIRSFDLLKAFGYIERVVKSDFFSNKTYFTSFVRNMPRAAILHKYHKVTFLDSRDGGLVLLGGGGPGEVDQPGARGRGN